ncbi:hypothetical protein H9649_09950 [Sporosarcina sp. Sa2YVA2]|uniref:ABC transporter permease n=1 Tax=Sporosarcina quadrami TaxID=2762234 RepID=A0ABR8UA43_9BACL|nr:hypothetical protein [Sporosarcina quadrami]MBD7984907.1 hypothetical protein [Sporosarcina quadrami]
MWMFWNYLVFEAKLLLSNKKNWLLGLVLILFFPIYYSHYSQTDIVGINEKKNAEAEKFIDLFDTFPGSVWMTDEGKIIREILKEQISLMNWQRLYLKTDGNSDGYFGAGTNFEKYFEAGLQLNELRLDLHRRGNKGIQRDHIMPVNEILKENALYRYHIEHEIPLVQDPFKANNYIQVALNLLSGTLFCLLVLLMGSSMLIHDQQHPSLLKGFPISFMRKTISKVGVHFVQLMLFMCASIGIGIYYVARKTGWGDFRAPVLIYQDADFIAVSVVRYLIYMVVAFALIALLLLLAFLLLNHVTKNLYASIVIILLILLSPQLLLAIGVETNWLYPLKFIDIGAVLSGDAAQEYGIDNLDFKHAYSWLVILNLLVISILYGRNKLIYRKKSGHITQKSDERLGEAG